MVREIAEILKQLGWVDGFRIPVSNEENKKLENMVEAKVKEKARLVADLEELDERLDALKRHMKNVTQEEVENLKLLAASRRQVDSAEHLHILVRSEYESLQRDRQNMKKKFEELEANNKKMEEELTQSSKKVSKLKKLMRWNSEELLAWEDLHSRKGEDLSFLQHLIDEDAARFKELEFKREALQMEVDKQHIVADEATTQVTVLEQVLDRIAQLYRQAHRDHQGLIHQWENSVQAMHTRDKEINDSLNEILSVRAEGRVKLAELIEAKELDAKLKSNNAETQAVADETHRQLNILRNVDQSLIKDLHELEYEVSGLKRELVGVGVQLRQQKAQNKNTKKEVIQREKKVENLKQVNDGLSDQFKEVSKNLWDAGQRCRHMEDAMKDEENLKETFHNDIQRLQAMFYRTTQELQAVREREKLQNSELCAIDKKKSGLLSLIEKVDNELFRMKDVIYGMDFNEQKLRTRISHAKGDIKSVDHKEKTEKLQYLEKILEEKKAVQSLLTSQTDCLENDVRQLSNKLSATSKEVANLKWKRQDGMALLEGGKKHLKAVRESHHNRLVEHALLRVRVDQMQRVLRREGSQVDSLKHQRVELECIMKKRQTEINLQKDLMLTKRKALAEERSQLNVALNQLKTKLDHLQNRFDIILNIMGKDESGEPISPALLKIKVAQEKVLLEEEGDVLDAKIKKAEKEIEAMENTLKVVNTSNDAYRKSLTMVDKDGPEGEELRDLEKEYYHAMLMLRDHREQQVQLEGKIKGLSEKLSELEQKEQEARAVNKDYELELFTLNKELQDQELKLHRAESQLKRVVRDLRSKSDSTMFDMEERDIVLREIIDQNQSGLEQLAEISTKFVETAPVIAQYLKEKGLSLPQPGQYMRSVGSTSTISGASSARSVRSTTSTASSCTAARRLIFDPSAQPVRSYHGTLQTPSQLVFPLQEKDVCCAPHSSLTLGSITHSQSDAGTLAGSTMAFETMTSIGSHTGGSLVEVHPAQSDVTLTPSAYTVTASHSSSAMTSASKEASQTASTSLSKRTSETSSKSKEKQSTGVQSTSKTGSISTSKHSSEASGKEKEKRTSGLESMVTVESVPLHSSSGKTSAIQEDKRSSRSGSRTSKGTRSSSRQTSAASQHSQEDQQSITSDKEEKDKTTHE